MNIFWQLSGATMHEGLKYHFPFILRHTLQIMEKMIALRKCHGFCLIGPCFETLKQTIRLRGKIICDLSIANFLNYHIRQSVRRQFPQIQVTDCRAKARDLGIVEFCWKYIFCMLTYSTSLCALPKNWGQIFIFDFTFSLFQEEACRSCDPASYVKNKDLTPYARPDPSIFFS